MDLQNQMKQAVALAAVDQIENGMILGLGSGSTAALMIEALAMKIKSGEIKDVTRAGLLFATLPRWQKVEVKREAQDKAYLSLKRADKNSERDWRSISSGNQRKG